MYLVRETLVQPNQTELQLHISVVSISTTLCPYAYEQDQLASIPTYMKFIEVTVPG